MVQDRFDTTPFWLTGPQRQAYAPLAADLSVDVVIVGGGISGVTAAYLMKRAGLRVAVVERHRIGSGQAGRSTAHVTAVSDVPLPTLTDRLGSEQAHAVWDAGFAAIARLRAIVRDERINCHFSWVPGYLHVAPGGDAGTERLDLARHGAMAMRLGIDAWYVDSVPGLNRPGVLFPNQVRLHPLMYLDVLLDRIHGEGSFVFEHSEVTALDESSCAVRVGRHRINAGYLVWATPVPVGRNASTASDLRSVTSHFVRAVAASTDLAEGLYWDQNDATYECMRVDRVDGHAEIVLGGHDRQPSRRSGDRQAFDALDATLTSRFPGARVTHQWTGQIVESHDGLPCIGEVGTRRFTATGFGHNGLTFGTLAGMMAADAALGRRSPWQSLFDIRRTTVGDSARVLADRSRDESFSAPVASSRRAG